MLYIGRKQYKVHKGKFAGIPHGWKIYTGSSKMLNEKIKEHGKGNFEFHVLEEYKTKGGLSWAEIWSLCYCKIPENNDLFYNRRIDRCSWKSTEKVTERHRRRLIKIVNKIKKGKK